MKICWTTGSVRFRITRAEMELLSDGRPAAAELAVLGDVWRATIVPSEMTGISLCCGNLTLSLDFEDIGRLADPTTEGVYFKTKSAVSLSYLVEKDYPGVHVKPLEDVESNQEAFAKPAGFADRHRRTKCV